MGSTPVDFSFEAGGEACTEASDVDGADACAEASATWIFTAEDGMGGAARASALEVRHSTSLVGVAASALGEALLACRSAASVTTALDSDRPA